MRLGWKPREVRKGVGGLRLPLVEYKGGYCPLLLSEQKDQKSQLVVLGFWNCEVVFLDDFLGFRCVY